MKRLAAKYKKTMAMKSNNQTEGRCTRKGALSLVIYKTAEDGAVALQFTQRR